MGNSRTNRYIIKVEFDSTEKLNEIFNGEIPYKGSNFYKDKLNIQSNIITIEADRSSIIALEDILINHFCSLYNQLIKSLLYYYVTTGKESSINSITLKRKRSKKYLDSKTFKKEEFNQLLDSSFNLKNIVDIVKAKELFEESEKGHSIFIAISYLLVSNNNLSETNRFEKLWRAFNRLYKFIGDNGSEMNCLIKLRELVLDNDNILECCLQTIDSIDVKDLRIIIRWRDMILNDYNKENQTKAFKDFIMRHKDYRIMKIIKDTKYGYREKYFKEQELFNEVESHIQKCISENLKSNAGLVTFLTGKYMYFVRNKIFHGETMDNSFRFFINKEDQELKFLNNILEAYIVDLINANDLY